jgi:hypothetical protein
VLHLIWKIAVPSMPPIGRSYAFVLSECSKSCARRDTLEIWCIPKSVAPRAIRFSKMGSCSLYFSEMNLTPFFDPIFGLGLIRALAISTWLGMPQRVIEMDIVQKKVNRLVQDGCTVAIGRHTTGAVRAQAAEWIAQPASLSEEMIRDTVRRVIGEQADA